MQSVKQDYREMDYPVNIGEISSIVCFLVVFFILFTSGIRQRKDSAETRGRGEKGRSVKSRTVLGRRENQTEDRNCTGCAPRRLFRRKDSPGFEKSERERGGDGKIVRVGLGHRLGWQTNTITEPSRGAGFPFTWIRESSTANSTSH